MLVVDDIPPYRIRNHTTSRKGANVSKVKRIGNACSFQGAVRQEMNSKPRRGLWVAWVLAKGLCLFFFNRGSRYDNERYHKYTCMREAISQNGAASER